jgi:hypothetical protein
VRGIGCSRIASSDRLDPDCSLSAFKAARNPRASRFPRNRQERPHVLVDDAAANASVFLPYWPQAYKPEPLSLRSCHPHDTYPRHDGHLASHILCEGFGSTIKRDALHQPAPIPESRAAKGTLDRANTLAGNCSPASYHHRNSRNGTRSELCMTWQIPRGHIATV